MQDLKPLVLSVNNFPYSNKWEGQYFTWQMTRAGYFYVNSTQARVNREEGASIKKMPLEDWATDKPVGHFLHW